MEAPRHKENILEALRNVPIATTRQLATLNDSLNPEKKASAILRDLQEEKLVTGEYLGRWEKIWSLTTKGRSLTGAIPTRCYNKAHAIAVGSLYFTCKPTRWMYEPREPFEHNGRKFEWRPDCILSFKGVLYAVEVQRSYPAGKKPWERKWNIYNLYFNHGYFEKAKFQQWAKSPPLIPQFLAITKQSVETVKCGFSVQDRDLLVVHSFG